MSDFARFIGHKAGCQRAIADLEPQDVGLVVTRRDGVLTLHACGNEGDSAVTMIGLLGWAQQEVYCGQQSLGDDNL